MNINNLSKDIIQGKRMQRGDDFRIFMSSELAELCRAADHIRSFFMGDFIHMCTIINGRSGGCEEDCKYCAQSAFNHASCEHYDFLPEEQLLSLCKENELEGVHRFSIVTSGRALTGKEFDQALLAYTRMKKECQIDLCASMGFLTQDQLRDLKAVGVTRYHHNIETSKNYFPHICTTHSYEDKIKTLKLVKSEGLSICSGGIIGMGETFEDRIDMALSLSELQVDSIPLNTLMAIEGTPFENLPPLSEEEILRTVAMFRFLNPTAHIRLGAGRALMENDGVKAFRAGASATITGNMLTTAACATIQKDKEMFQSLGRTF